MRRHVEALVFMLFFGLFASAERQGGFVQTSGTQFVLEGEPFRIVGANNYYLMYKSNTMIDAVFEAAANMNLNVIRTWGFLDRGSLDGRVRSVNGSGHADGIYFHC
jgi:mannan endo-1,4-beta-mannosidase